jgi:hypothetical protein
MSRVSSVGGLGRRAVAIAAFAGASLVASVALGDDARARAKAAYEAGAAAAGRHDYAEAARRFAEADELAPNDVTLTEALKAAARADDPVLGMRLVDRAESRHGAAPLAGAAAAAREKLAARASRVTLACPDERPCEATLDGAAAPLATPIWTSPGAHRATFTTDPSTSHPLDVAAGAAITFRPPAPARPLPPPPAPLAEPLAPIRPLAPAPASAFAPAPDTSRTGPSSAWFWIAAGTTVALAGVTAWSGADAVSLHDKWEKGDDAAKASGQDAQLRTNVLLGVTGAALVGTVIVAVLTFKKPSRSAAARAPAGPLSGAF